jgi:hypothetical protein
MTEMQDIRKDPEYKASMEVLDAAIRDHFTLIEAWANEHGEGDDVDTSTVIGWTLVIGTVGFNSESGEYHDAVCEMPDSLNKFTAVGLAQYGYGFHKNSIDNYTGRGRG